MSVKKFAEWALGKCGYNSRHEEVLDPTPVEIPVGFTRPPSLQEEMRMFLGEAVQRELAGKGVETFEEANDFSLPDEELIESPWQDPEYGEMWTREEELKAGAVEIPDFQTAKALAEKAKAVLDKYDSRGNLKAVKEVSK